MLIEFHTFIIWKFSFTRTASYYLHLANVLQAGALPERLDAGSPADLHRLSYFTRFCHSFSVVAFVECKMVVASQVLPSMLFNFFVFQV
jgi:hypothetical protein